MNPWTTLKSLGEGGQGHIFLVKGADGTDQRTLVLKRLKNIDRSGRFEAEITALSRLRHPNIVRIEDYGEEKGKPFLVMEYCESGDLTRIDLVSYSLRERLSMFRQVCLGVAAAHDKNLIHRDLKPQNILVRADGSLAVGDFGLCLDLDEQDERQTLLSEAVGPRDYIAPELEGSRSEDPKPSCDCYSLGKLLYYFLVKRTVPRERHREPRYNLLVDGADPALYFVYDLLDRSLVESPESRLQNGTEFLNALDTVLEKMDNNAHVLDLKVPQKCVFCVEGRYQLGLAHNPTAYETERPVRKSAFNFFGTNAFDQKPWMALVCDTCGNVQFFRRDLTSDPSRWKNVT